MVTGNVYLPTYRAYVYYSIPVDVDGGGRVVHTIQIFNTFINKHEIVLQQVDIYSFYSLSGRYWVRLQTAYVVLLKLSGFRVF